MVSLILLAISAVGAIASGTAKSVQLSKQKNLLNKQLSELGTWYERNRSVDLLDNTEIKESIREQSKIQKQQNRELSANISKGGLSPEREVALASSKNLNWGEQLSKIAKNDSQNKKEVESTYRNNANNIYNSINGINNGIVNNAIDLTTGITSNALNLFRAGTDYTTRKTNEKKEAEKMNKVK